MSKLTLFMIALLSIIPSIASASYTQISSSTTNPAGLVRTQTIVQDGSNTVDRFEMTRVRRSSGPVEGAVLLLPGGNTNFESYEIFETGTYANSLAGYLASNGFEVWGYSPRSKGIPLGTCDVPFSCPYILNWNFATIANDAEYIRSQVVSTIGVDPAVAGWSLGAMSATAAANRDPSKYSGLLTWEGMLYSANSTVVTANTVNCLTAQTQLLAGVNNNSTTYLISVLPSAVFQVVATTPLSAPPSYVPSYTLLVGNLLGYTYASVPRINTFLPNFNPVESNVLAKEIYCSLAGDRTYTGNLGSFTKPVYTIRSGHAFGPYMLDQVALYGSAVKDTSNYQANYGHADTYLASNHATFIDGPMLNWLDSVVFP